MMQRRRMSFRLEAFPGSLSWRLRKIRKIRKERRRPPLTLFFLSFLSFAAAVCAQTPLEAQTQRGTGEPAFIRMPSMNMADLGSGFGTEFGTGFEAALEASVPQLSYPEEEGFTEIAAINGEDAPDYHSTAFWFEGHLGIFFSKGIFDGGVSLFDLSDPYHPQLVGQAFNSGQREGHTTAFIETDEGMMAVTLASNGLNVWDLQEVRAPKIRATVSLPGVLPSDYDFGAWWLAAQGDLVFVAGSYNGIYVVDLGSLDRPKLLAQVHISGGFRCGSIYAVGNLLVQMTSEGILTRIYDISDPSAPALIREFEQTYSAYSGRFSGGYLYLASERGGAEIIDLHDPSNPVFLGAIDYDGGGAYLTVQDDSIHLGNSKRYYKIDASDPGALETLGSATITTELPEKDVDFVSHLGNLVVLGDDHTLGKLNNGSRIVVHQTSPDTLPPHVTYVNPADGAADIALTSRIGVSFSDHILISSVSPETFILQTPEGVPVEGRLSVQQDIVAFRPSDPLEPETEYQIVIPAGGVRDLAGNPVDASFFAAFTTGPPVVHPPSADAGADLTAWIDETIVLDGSGSRAGVGRLEYSWDPGDGSGASAYSYEPTLEHVYRVPGHYSAILRIRDQMGQESSDEVRVSAVYRPLEDVPRRTTTIDYDEQGHLVWCVNPDSDTVTAIDAATYEKVVEIEVPSHPTTLSVDGEGDVWVATREGHALVRIDSDYLYIVDRIDFPVGSRPYGVLTLPDSSAVYVTLEGTQRVVALDPVGGDVLWESALDGPPRGLAWVEDALFVSRFISPSDQGEVYELAPVDGVLRDIWTLALDPGPDSDIGGRGVPNYISQIVPSPDGRSLFVPSIKQNTGRGLYVSGEAMVFENTNRAIVSKLDLELGGEDLDARRDIDNRDHAVAIALTSLGDYGFVVLQGAQSVVILDMLSGQEVGALNQVGLAPQGALLLDDETLFVQNFLGRDVTVFDVSSFDEAETLRRIAQVRTVGRELLTQEELTGKRIFYNSSDTRMAKDNYISCAGCHLDGRSDKRVWDFTDRGEGLRRTTTLMGRAGMAHGPVHWTANFNEIQDFENDIRNAFGGSGFLSDADFESGTRSEPLGDPKAGLSPELDAMAAYVKRLALADLSPYRDADGRLTEAAVRGRALFFSSEVGCGGCHLGPHYTDSTLTEDAGDYLLHDVGTLTEASGSRMGGTLDGLDTPTLKGVWDNAPYLHDGSAQTLRAVLVDRNVGDQHGRTSGLSASELDDLEAFVASIDGHSGAPEVISMLPREGAWLWSPKEVVLTLSSIPDEATLNESTVELVLNSNRIGVSLRREDNRIVMTPADVLEAGDYEVRVHEGLLSVDGEAAIPWTGTFHVADRSGLQLISNVKGWSSNGDFYSLETNFKLGSKIYGDEDHVVVRLPSAYQGALYIRTANADRRETRPGLLTFDLSAEAYVFVAFEVRHFPLPGWAADFEPTQETLFTSDGNLMPIFRARMGPGRVVLGGARASGGDHNDNNYVVFALPLEE